MPDIGDVYPELTAYAKSLLEQPQPEYNRKDLPYLGYFSKEDEPYDVTDYPTVRSRLQDNVAAAIASRFPLESDKYILALENIGFADKVYTPREEKDALLHGKTLGTKVKGDWVLYDKATGKEIERKANTLVNIPYLTNRGVFIRSGNEYGLRNTFRLRPGIYTRIKSDGVIASHVNPAQGTGTQSNIILNPTNGVFTWKIGSRNYGLLPLMFAAGETEENIRKVWGDELFENNYKKYANIIEGKSKREAEEYIKLWDDKLSKEGLDEDTTKETLGEPFKKLNGKALLATTSKLLRVAQTYTDEETDDRDSLKYQTIAGAADYLPERIIRDGGGVFKKVLNNIDRDGNLSSVNPGVFQPHIDAIFQEARHATYIDGANPLEGVDISASLSRIGEGGLGTERAASEESRGVNNSYLGFVDPIRSSESQNVGLQVFLTHGVRKDSKGRLWTKVMSPGHPTPYYANMQDMMRGTVATPEFFDPNGDPDELIPAFRHGGDLDYIPRRDVDYYIADSSNLMSDNTGFIAGIGGIRSNRTMLGSKSSIQALSLPNREAPLVRRFLNTDKGPSTTEEFMGRKLGAKFADMDGVVTAVDDDKIVYRGADGKKHQVDLYNNLPANNKGWLHNTPLVKPGDAILEGQPIAKSNYTDDNGVAANGVNLRVAMINGPNAGTSLDAITVSESAARTKLASEQLYKTRVPKDNETEYDKNKFLRSFNTSDFTKEQLDTIGEDGIVKPGTELHKGDPMVLGISLRDVGIRGVSKKAMTPLIKTWEHDYPGTVTDIGDSSKNFTVYTKALTPAKVGDKMCFDVETEILTGTRGWIPVKKLNTDDTVYTMNPDNPKEYELQHPSVIHAYQHSGPMYVLRNAMLDICVTDNHRNVVAFETTDDIRLVESRDLFGKPRWHFISDPRNEQYDEPYFLDPAEDDCKEGWIHYDDWVYCCMVPKWHTLYVRRNGKPCWSGNSTVFGNKGVIGQILPDDEMLQDKDGRPFEVYQSPMGIPSRVNPMVLGSLQLGKIAKHRGEPVVWKDFPNEPMADTVLRMLQENGLQESEDLYDPSTGKTIPDVDTGYLYYLKFKHMGDSKEKARGTGDYTLEGLPLKGGKESARRFGSMEIGALIGHTGVNSEILKDAKLIRGQENNEFWRAVRNGDQLPRVDIPLVHRKFFAHLQAAGVNLEDRGNRIHMFAADDKDIKNLTQNRQVMNNSTYDAKDLRPAPGGLFDPGIFGPRGDQWAYYQLPEPILNPLMEKSVANILGWKEQDLQGVLNGEQSVDGKLGSKAVQELLSKMDIGREFEKVKTQLKSENLPALKRDKLLKKYRALGSLLREGKNPADLFLTRIPILPPRFRPVSVLGNDVGIVSDANYLYKAMIDAAQDFEDAKKALPEEMQLDARKNLHQAITSVVGLTDSPDRKLQEKNVEGVLKWAFGKGSPKFGSLHRKVYGATDDLGGLAVASPDSRLSIDEIGLPEESAWSAFEPFVVRNLRRKQNYALSDAMKAVQERTPAAKRALEEEMSRRPVLVNRAPTLHKYNILAFWPRITKGTTIRYNPLVSKGYNVDADGDLMSFHVPVSKKAIKEAADKMMPSKNLFSPATLQSHILPLEEFAQGLYLASRPGKGKPVKFRTKADMLRALNAGEIKYDTPVDIEQA